MTKESVVSGEIGEEGPTFIVYKEQGKKIRC